MARTRTASLTSVLKVVVDREGREPPAEVTDERILDAALTVISQYGTKRATIDEIADLAGVARATVFRRFSGKGEIVERVFARELRRFMAELAAIEADPDDPASYLVELLTTCVRTARIHPLVQRVATAETRTLMEIITESKLSVMEVGRAAFAAPIRAAYRRRDPGFDPERVADLLLHVVIGYTFVPASNISSDDEAGLREVARAVLAPTLAGVR